MYMYIYVLQVFILALAKYELMQHLKFTGFVVFNLFMLMPYKLHYEHCNG